MSIVNELRKISIRALRNDAREHLIKKYKPVIINTMIEVAETGDRNCDFLFDNIDFSNEAECMFMLDQMVSDNLDELSSLKYNVWIGQDDNNLYATFSW